MLSAGTSRPTLESDGRKLPGHSNKACVIYTWITVRGKKAQVNTIENGDVKIGLELYDEYDTQKINELLL